MFKYGIPVDYVLHERSGQYEQVESRGGGKEDDGKDRLEEERNLKETDIASVAIDTQRQG